VSENLKCALEAYRQVEPLRRYANLFEIEFSISEVDLRFAQRFGNSDEALIQGWMVTTPVHLVRLAEAVNDAIASYQHRFGPIPSAASSGGGD